MLDLAEIDRRKYHLAIEKEVRRINSLPIDLDSIRANRTRLQSSLEEFEESRKVMTPGELPDLEIEIARIKDQLIKVTAELTERESLLPEEPEPQSPPLPIKPEPHSDLDLDARKKERKSLRDGYKLSVNGTM